MKGRKLLILQYGRSCKNGPSAELGYTAGTRNRFAKFAFREKFHVSREVTFSRITSAHGAWSPDRAPWHHAERMYEARPMMGKSADGRPGTSRFDRFVRSYGIERLAKRLDITRSAVQHWLRGSMSPHPANAFKIRELAKERGVALSLDEIYEHFRQVGSERYTDSRTTPLPARSASMSSFQRMQSAGIPGNTPHGHA